MKSSALGVGALLLVACGSAESPGSTATTSGSAGSSSGGAGGGSGGGGAGAGGSAPALPEALRADLLGDFDNAAQHAMGLPELVERHVCVLPGRDGDPAALWLYVEELDDTSGKRETYSTRVHEITVVAGQPVTRIYKLAEGHPLATDPFKVTGARDGCSKPAILQAITDADLLYRDGCDLTLVPAGASFQASTAADTCAVPGGFINTEAVVSPDGLTRTDSFHDATSKKSTLLSTFEFLRVAPAP